MSYQFKDSTAQTYFSTIVEQWRAMMKDPETLPSNFEALTPFLPDLRIQFEPMTVEQWPHFMKALATVLIEETIRYTPMTMPAGIYFLDGPGIQAAYRSLITTAYPASFKFSGNSGLDHHTLGQILHQAGFVAAEPGDEIGVLSLEWEPQTSKYNPADVSLPSIVKSILGSTKTTITNKEHLYFNLVKVGGGGAMAPTQILKAVHSITPGTVHIVRPVGPMACSGRGISLVTNNAELAAARRKVRPFKSAIISQYIDPPLLWEGRKFHIRMYYLVRAAKRNLPFHAELWSRGSIMTAGLPYKSGDWQNCRIHDTHGKTTPRILWFPEDLPEPHNAPHIFAQMEATMKLVQRALEPSLTIYPESIYAYEVFGCDFMIDASNHVFLLEINDHVGYPSESGSSSTAGYTVSQFGHDYDYWIYDRIIRPIYFPESPPLDLPRFV
jgi:hypothetical protein